MKTHPAHNTMRSSLLKKAFLPLSLVLLIMMGLSTGCQEEEEDKTGEYLTALALMNTRFTDNKDGTVSASGKMWMKCSIGQQYNGGLNDCSGTGGYTTYGAESYGYCEIEAGCYDLSSFEANAGPAYNACQNLDFAGHTDWRLPTRYELAELTTNIEYSAFVSVFPQTPDDKYYWSGTTNQDATGEAVGVSFAEGTFGTEAFFDKVNGKNYVRCIRP